jgi:hypothetical protein
MTKYYLIMTKYYLIMTKYYLIMAKYYLIMTEPHHIMTKYQYEKISSNHGKKNNHIITIVHIRQLWRSIVVVSLSKLNSAEICNRF